MLTVLMTRAFDRFFFFFSSRRRHTRCSRDWSSDVCSSDLIACLQTGQQTSDVGLGFPHVPAARLARGFGGATDFPAFLGSHGAYPTRDRPGHLQQLIAAVLQREQIALSQICYDGTNFYTFIDTFNLQSQLAKRGKNKQGRSNLRQVSYALFCTTDEHLPLFYDVYEGNRNDAKQFPQVLEKFQRWLKERAGSTWTATKPTLIFDKGNN